MGDWKKDVIDLAVRYGIIDDPDATPKMPDDHALCFSCEGPTRIVKRIPGYKEMRNGTAMIRGYCSEGHRISRIRPMSDVRAEIDEMIVDLNSRSRREKTANLPGRRTGKPRPGDIVETVVRIVDGSPMVRINRRLVPFKGEAKAGERVKATYVGTFAHELGL